MIRFFKLEGKVAVSVPLEEYIQWLMTDPDHGSPMVRVDLLKSGDELLKISTVFLLGSLDIDNRYVRDLEPFLFETMVFGEIQGQNQWRYSTWEQAEIGHQEVLEQILREKPHLIRVGPESLVEAQ